MQFTDLGNNLFCLSLRRKPQFAGVMLIPVDTTAHCWLAKRSPYKVCKWAGQTLRIHFARKISKKTLQRPGRQGSCKFLAVIGWGQSLRFTCLCPQTVSSYFVKTLPHSAPALPLAEEGTATHLFNFCLACKLICAACVPKRFLVMPGRPSPC